MLERKRAARQYNIVPGEEDVELGEGLGEDGGQGSSVTAGGTRTLEEEVDQWDENNWSVVPGPSLRFPCKSMCQPLRFLLLRSGLRGKKECTTDMSNREEDEPTATEDSGDVTKASDDDADGADVADSKPPKKRNE